MDDDPPLQLHSLSSPSSTRTPRIFDRFTPSSPSSPSSSSSDELSPSQSATKKLDYMIQFLDRKLTTTNATSSATSATYLPEFVAAGGGTGLFKLPLRSAVRPDRPPSLELRPRPRRETQVGVGLRVLASVKEEVWAGGEDGRVRCWEMKEVVRGGGGGGGGERKESRGGDEMTAGFKEGGGGGAEVVCMVGDEGEGVVYSGHKDGKIRCWRVVGSSGRKKRRDSGGGGGGGGEEIKECFSWLAHRGPVLSMVITSYGE